MRAAFRVSALIVLTLALSGCTLSLDWLHILRARRAAANGDPASAVKILERVREHEPDGQRALTASRYGSRIAQFEAKDYNAAVEFNRHLILRSDDPDERVQAQKNVAQIYFENLQDYAQAVQEIEKILKLNLPPEEAFRYRLNLAKSHFQLNNLEQAASEIDVILSKKLRDDDIFDAKQVKANIEVAAKNLPAAAQIWEEILKQFPDRAKREKVAMNLVVCYEEMKDFTKAIEALEFMKADDPNPEFIELRIQKLKERKINQPGAGGWKR